MPSANPEASPTLSLCMIVKNEEHFLGRCLAAVRDHVDEIVVVDTGSTDSTRAIAGEYGSQLYDFQWNDNYSDARNFALAQAGSDWILVLDADEIIAEEDLQAIRQLIAITDCDAFYLQQYNYSNDPLVKDWRPVADDTPYSGGFTGYRSNPIARLFRNYKGIGYQGRVHEVIDLSLAGLPQDTLEIPIHHHMHGNPSRPSEQRQLDYLAIMEEELEKSPDGRLSFLSASICLRQAGDYDKAIRYYQQARDLGYDEAGSQEGQAEAFYRQGKLDEARRVYLQLYQSGYVSFSLCNNLANLLVKNGENGLAAQLLRQALALGVLSEEVAARVRANIDVLESRGDTFH